LARNGIEVFEDKHSLVGGDLMKKFAIAATRSVPLLDRPKSRGFSVEIAKQASESFPLD